MVTAVEIRGYEPLFTEDNRRLCGCLAPLLSLPASQAQTKYPVLHHSIAHSSLFPTSMYLHWHFRPKKWFFWKKKFLPPKKYFFLPFFNATFQWGPRKSEKAGLKSCSAQTLFSHCPAQTTAHSPELIFQIMKSRDQTSVLLFVSKGFALPSFDDSLHIKETFKGSLLHWEWGQGKTS